MRKRKVRPVKTRKSWTINPRIRVKESRRLYKRPKIKKETIKVYENQIDEFEA